MKKVLILIIICFSLCGCTKIEDKNMDLLVNQILKIKVRNVNQYRKGFKYYLPGGVNIINSKDSNIEFKKNNVNYYMYVDLIRYYYKENNQYKVNKDAYLSKELVIDDKKGYIEINLKNDKYLIEIMYNYAKIEVILEDSNDISEVIVDSLIILSSVDYNDEIIRNMLEDDILNFDEEAFSIFDTESDDSNFLKVIEEYDNYNEDEIPDFDLIKENE